MSYGKHYTTQSAAKSGKLFTFDIYENGYSGSIVNIPAGLNPFEQDVLASSDDAYDPILASELQVKLDVTDATVIPDLTSRDDRKYYGKLYAQDYPQADTATILWKNYEVYSPLIDTNLQILVNGVYQVIEALPNSGTLTVNAGDVIQVVLDNGLTSSVPSGGGWIQQIQKDGVDIQNVTTSTPVIGHIFTYTFTAQSQSVYGVLTTSYEPGYPAATVPVNNTYPIFQGLMLMDASRVSFSTGRKFLDLSFVDGLGMLKSILYQDNYLVAAPSNQNGAVMVDINTKESLLQICLNCLNKIGLPNGFNLNIACNIYATGMVTTSDSFSQILYYMRNWLTAEITFQDCYTVLESIVRSFGCQLFQANNEYWIANVNDRCGTLRYFKYDQTGALVSSGTIAPSRTIKPYDGTAPHYFVNNGQFKEIRKGYPVIEIKSPYTYAPNLIDNGNLKRPLAVSGFEVYYNWAIIYPMPSPATIIQNNYDGYNWITMNLSTASLIYCNPSSVAPVSSQDRLTLSFLLAGRSTISVTPILKLQIKLTSPDGSDVYYLDNTEASTTVNGRKVWIHTSTSYTYVVGNTTSDYENISVVMPPCPINGTLSIQFILDASRTLLNAEFANVALTATYMYESRDTKAYNTLITQYKKELSDYLGYYNGSGNSLLGNLLRANTSWPNYPLVWQGWYRYGVTESYVVLQRLVIQQIVNCQSAAQINVSGSIMSLFGNNDASVYGPFTLIDTLKFQDGTSILNIGSTYYIFGNCRINYTDDTISGTFLNVNNTDISETIADIDVLKYNQ